MAAEGCQSEKRDVRCGWEGEGVEVLSRGIWNMKGAGRRELQNDEGMIYGSLKDARAILLGGNRMNGSEQERLRHQML